MKLFSTLIASSFFAGASIGSDDVENSSGRYLSLTIHLASGDFTVSASQNRLYEGGVIELLFDNNSTSVVCTTLDERAILTTIDIIDLYGAEVPYRGPQYTWVDGRGPFARGVLDPGEQRYLEINISEYGEFVAGAQYLVNVPINVNSCQEDGENTFYIPYQTLTLPLTGPVH